MIDSQAEQIIRGNPDKSSADVVALIAALPPIAKPSNPATTYATYLLIGLMFGDNPAGSLRSQLPTWGSPTDLSTLNAALPNPGALQALHARLDGYPGVDMASPNAPALLGLFSTGIPAINLVPLLTSDQANALLAIGYQLPVVPTADEVDAWRAADAIASAKAISLAWIEALRLRQIALLDAAQAAGAAMPDEATLRSA